MQINSQYPLTQAEQNQLIKQLTPFVQGVTHKSGIQLTIGNKNLTVTYSAGVHKTISVTNCETVKEKLAVPKKVVKAKKVTPAAKPKKVKAAAPKKVVKAKKPTTNNQQPVTKSSSTK